MRIRRLFLFGALVAVGGVYFQYRALKAEEALMPRMEEASSAIGILGERFESLKKFGVRTFTTSWLGGCAKHTLNAEGREASWKYYRLDLGSLLQIVEQVETKGAWKILGQPAGEAFERLHTLTEWIRTDLEDQEAWQCREEGTLGKFERLAAVADAYATCFGAMRALNPRALRRGGTPAVRKCVAELPTTVDVEAAVAANHDAHPAESSLAERVVDLGRGQPGDMLVPVLVGERRRSPVVVSPDGTRVAYLLRRGAQQLVVVDGVEGPPYERVWEGMEVRLVGGPQWSPDSRHVAYRAQRDGKWVVVLDGRELPTAWDGIEYLVLARDDHYAFLARREHGWHVVVDGHEMADPPSRLAAPIFSADGRHFAYASGVQEKGAFVVVDGVHRPTYEALLDADLVFGPDSTRLAYAAKRNGRPIVVVEGKEFSAYDGLLEGGVRFSPDARHVAFVAKREGQQVVVVDNDSGAGFDGVGEPRFSADSRRLAYIGKRGTRWFAVVDGEESAAYDDLTLPGPHFSPDSRRVGWAGKQGNVARVVVDGVEGPPYSAVGTDSPLFSPDSSRFAYIAARDHQAFVVLDGREAGPYERIHGSIAWSPDSKRTAFVVQKGLKQFVVVDEREHAPCDEVVTAPVFSPDSARVAYVVRRDGRMVVVVNGEAQTPYHEIVPASLRFSDDGAHLVYAAWRDGWRLVVDGVASTHAVASLEPAIPLRIGGARVELFAHPDDAPGVQRLEVTLPEPPARTALR